MEVFLIVLIGLVVLGVFLMNAKDKDKNKKRVVSLIDNAFGGNAKYSFAGVDTGIAVSEDLSQVLLISRLNDKIYSPDQIRSHEIRDKEIVEPRRRAGRDMVSQIRAGKQEVEDKMRVAESFGLFVTVKDIDNGEWRIAIERPAERQKWNEIMNQVRGV